VWSKPLTDRIFWLAGPLSWQMDSPGGGTAREKMMVRAQKPA
jgi:hypothetical protein